MNSRSKKPVLGALAATILVAVAPAQGSNAERVEGARTALQEWVEVSDILSKERQDWALGKEILQDRIDVLKREIESLQEKIAEAEKNIETADQRKVELAEENERLGKAVEALDEAIVPLEEKTLKILKRLPDPLRERVQSRSQRIPDPNAEDEDDGKKKRPVPRGERYLNVLGVLEQIDRFNREVSPPGYEMRKLADGSTAEVTVFYVGLGQAYYVSAKGDQAGVGTATPDGWEWVPVDSAAVDVEKAVGILRGERAEFVRLPVRLY